MQSTFFFYKTVKFLGWCRTGLKNLKGLILKLTFKLFWNVVVTIRCTFAVFQSTIFRIHETFHNSLRLWPKQNSVPVCQPNAVYVKTYEFVDRMIHVTANSTCKIYSLIDNTIVLAISCTGEQTLADKRIMVLPVQILCFFEASARV